MKSGLQVVALAVCAVIAGFFAGETACRFAIERGNDEARRQTIIAKNLRYAVKDTIVSQAEMARELELLRDQFVDEQRFEAALESSNLTERDLRAEVEENLRERAWIERQIAPALGVSEAETRAYYEAHRDQFLQPQRFRVSHIFLAAPTGTAPEVVAAKQSAIQGLAVRLLAGEKFAPLAAEASEDEATKANGGDLGFFSSARMPPEFIAEIVKLHRNELSSPIRSHLGFHLLQETDALPPRPLSYAEARPEIELSLGNRKRTLAVAQLQERLSAE